VRARRLGPGAVDELRQDIERDSRLGIGYLGIGAVIVGIILLVRGLIALGTTWVANDGHLLSAAGWLLVLLAFAGAVVLARRGRGILPLWGFQAVLAIDGVALALDYTALWIDGGWPNQATVIIGVGSTLLASVTFRPMLSILLADIALAVVAFGAFAVDAVRHPGFLGEGIELVIFAVVPTIVAVVIVRSFGQFVQRELDRSVVEGTIGAPQFGLGIFASTELARLDLAAEEMLQSVATGRVALPLDRELANTASSLASDLRLMLVAGRRETWLHHAIAESEYLGPAVTLDDPDGLAAYLEPAQRDGLLSAIWLIVDESGRQNPTIDLRIGPRTSSSATGADDRMVLPIALSIRGITRRRIDPAVWPALDRVGHHSEDARRGRLRVAVDASVVVPDATRQRSEGEHW
jgi:hypothetical protein